MGVLRRVLVDLRDVVLLVVYAVGAFTSLVLIVALAACLAVLVAFVATGVVLGVFGLLYRGVELLKGLG